MLQLKKTVEADALFKRGWPSARVDVTTGKLAGRSAGSQPRLRTECAPSKDGSGTLHDWTSSQTPNRR